jgi:hypothetical protein
MEDDKKETEQTEQTVECPLCQISPVLMGIGSAHTACSLVKDPEKKAKCMSWVDSIDPKDIKNAETVFAGILENAGIEEADKTAKTFNLGMQNAILDVIGKKIERNDKVTEMEMSAYKQILKSRGV